jgi:hypothetical protein
MSLDGFVAGPNHAMDWLTGITGRNGVGGVHGDHRRGPGRAKRLGPRRRRSLGTAAAPTGPFRSGRRRGRPTSRVGGGCEAGAVPEEAAEVGRVGETGVAGDRAGGPPGVAEETARFEQAALIDDLPCSGAEGGPGRAAEGSCGTTEQPGVVVDAVQLAEVQLQGVQESFVDRPSCRDVARGGVVSAATGAAVTAGELARRSSRASRRLRRRAWWAASGRRPGARCSSRSWSAVCLSQVASSGCGVSTAGASCEVRGVGWRAMSGRSASGSNRMKGSRAAPGSCQHRARPGRTHSHWPERRCA